MVEPADGEITEAAANHAYQPEFGEPAEPGEPGESHELFESAEPGEPGEPAEAAPPVPERYARLGAEGLAGVRARYADLVARIAAREMEDDQRADLVARAGRLNPDAWATADEVAAALEEYETVFESLRAVVGRQPRSRRL